MSSIFNYARANRVLQPKNFYRFIVSWHKTVPIDSLFDNQVIYSSKKELQKAISIFNAQQRGCPHKHTIKRYKMIAKSF